ncbi:hypothetical protein B0H13DRAFT_1883145 [Mycena leptocephala]|nr:hypothetical protein B0H13DRAFT_1883145 [Mycena leptocephala]
MSPGGFEPPSHQRPLGGSSYRSGMICHDPRGPGLHRRERDRYATAYLGPSQENNSIQKREQECEPARRIRGVLAKETSSYAGPWRGTGAATRAHDGHRRGKDGFSTARAVSKRPVE